MNIVFMWIVYIFLFLFFAMIVVFNVARVIYFIKCIRVKRCSKDSCHFKIFCDKYHEKLTEEDIERIQKMLDRYGELEEERKAKQRREQEQAEQEKREKEEKNQGKSKKKRWLK